MVSSMTVRTSIHEIGELLRSLEIASADYATQFVDHLLHAALAAGASDVHLQPTQTGLDVLWRRDGVLQRIGEFPSGESTDVVTRLKVLAELLTYRSDTPQEGRIRSPQSSAEMRVSTFPILYGERAAVRIFAGASHHLYVGDLGFPGSIVSELQQQLQVTSGAILITGPAGSGKTTTAYACLRQLVQDGQQTRSILTLEDPIEVAVNGIVQAQVNENAQLDLAHGLRSLLRQDPEVLLVGEIRDRQTAEVTMEASLTGHLVLTTFHAGSAATAISRLLDMGIEPYLLQSGIQGILSQRLLRRLCECKQLVTEEKDRMGLDIDQSFRAVGCDKCQGIGYRGRIAVAELLTPAPSEMGRAILSRRSAAELQELAEQSGLVTCWQRAFQAVRAGDTSAAEVRRVFGLRAGFADDSNGDGG